MMFAMAKECLPDLQDLRLETTRKFDPRDVGSERY
jgi:hypothetical protein